VKNNVNIKLNRFSIKNFVFSWQQFEEEMKKLFIVLLLLLVACGEEINTPEVSNDVTQFNSSTVSIDSVSNIISTSISGQRIILDGNTNQILFFDKNNLLAGKITAATNAGLPTFLFTAFDASFESAYLRNSGHIISNQSIFAKEGLEAGSSSFVVDAQGKITSVSGIKAKEGYVLAGDEEGFSPKRLAMWRGELQTDPQDGVSGDEYYNIQADKIKIYIEHKKSWINK